MTEITADRRALFGLAAAAAAAVAPALAQAQPAAAPAPTYPIRPLPFDPKTITGLSEKLLVSHHDNNYAGAVRRLGQIQGQLNGLEPAAPGFQLNGLKREELLAWNSMILHELYFAQFGRPNRPVSALAQAIEKDFGSDARWRAQFAALGKALGGGSGWALLVWSPHDGKLANQWAADHTMTLAGGVPILALDMYEHAYHIDYGSNAGAYVDAFMAAVDWTNANQVFARATRA
jgi:superoxide dismutase, Fe-Mn family